MTNYNKILFGNSKEDVITLLDEQISSSISHQDSLKTIRDWYQMQPHLPQHSLEDSFLIRFYYEAKYSIEKTKRKLDDYFSVRSIFPEFFQDRNPFGKDMMSARDCVEFAMMPKITVKNHRVVITRYTEKDPSLLDVTSLFKMIFMINELRLEYETVSGDLYVWDLKNLKLGHILKINPLVMKKILFIVQNCYGSRIKGIYILNMPSYAQNIVNAIKGLLKKKIAERICICESLEDLHNHVDRKYLPIELGGAEYTCKNVLDLCMDVMQSEEWVRRFKESEQLKSNEQLRQNADDRMCDMLGVMGSFKKLDID